MLNLSTPSEVNGASVTDFGKQRFETWNSIAQEQAGAVSVVQLVTRQAELSPQASAVTHGAMSLSYGELNERANQLAHLVTPRASVILITGARRFVHRARCVDYAN